MKRNRGVALITAVLVIALAAIVAAAMLSSSNLAIHRASTLSDTERAWWYADGIETWVKSILMLDAQNSQVDYLGEAWAKPVDYLPVDEGSLRGGITDLNGLFNLNNLSYGDVNPNDATFLKYKHQFERLLTHIDALKDIPAEGLAEAIHDWTDTNDQPMGFGGAEDSEYTTLKPPYRAPNRQMTSVSELLAVKGVTKELYLALRDYVCALPTTSPGDWKINVNTAPLPVLQSLGEATGDLAQFVQSRADKYADSPATFWSQYFQQAAQPAGQNSEIGPGDLAVESQYFLLHGEAFIGSSHLALYSVVHRPPRQSGGVPAVISRSQDPY